MNRRRFVITGAAAAVASPFAARSALAGQGPEPTESRTWAQVLSAAEKLSKAPYVAPVERVEPLLQGIGYDVYRDIQHRDEHALWHGLDLGFEVKFSPTAYIYHTPIEVFVVDGDKVTPIELTASQFKWGRWARDLPRDTTLLCSGFRVLAPLNSTTHLDEVVVFQGASYFRGLGRGHQYGLSARGLALNVAGPGDEEFPLFRSFWLERPTHPSHVVIYALLDSSSTSGAYRFVIWPGLPTIMDTEAVLFPRVDLAKPGIAPLTSMFWFDGRDVPFQRDFRGAVHDSDGLIALTRGGEWLWRPLSSPEQLQSSAFQGANPRGFGLLQRTRDFTVFQDLEARYERRPGAWVERMNDWGDGHVELIEIPAKNEWYDNIVAYWRPAAPLRAGERHDFAYRLHWCNEPPATEPLFRVKRTGLSEDYRGVQRFVVDFEGAAPPPAMAIGHVDDAFGIISRLPEAPRLIKADLSASAGLLGEPTTQANPHINGVRVSFELDPKQEAVIELRLSLVVGNEVNSEVWLYRWLMPMRAAAAATPASQGGEVVGETPKAEETGK